LKTKDIILIIRRTYLGNDNLCLQLSVRLYRKWCS